jgi:hypothetical protein
LPAVLSAEALAKADRQQSQQSPAVSYQQDANSTLMTVGAFGQKAN